MSIKVHGFAGKAAEPFIHELARLRIEVFREFPYLYDGSADYEQTYLRTYLDVPESVIVIAFDGDRVIGASTGLPMSVETDEVKRPFIGTDTIPSRSSTLVNRCSNVIIGAVGWACASLWNVKHTHDRSGDSA